MGLRRREISSAPTLPVPLGGIVADKYRLERVLGAGGMGCVVEATHLDLQQRVALKFLLEARRDDPECATRFIREARAAAALASDHVARVLDTGTLESGEPFIVLEYLEGMNLDEKLQRAGKLSPEETVSIFSQACDALSEAHGLGIVHRDIKPTNIFLAKRPNGRTVVKVLDFGISKSLYAGDIEDLTGSATILGTPHYMAPEQMTSTKDAEAPADVWALGVCMYKCLAGRLPFEEAMTLMELGAFVLAHDPPSIHTVAPTVPGSLAAIVMQCLQRDPRLRFADAGDLLRVLSGSGIPAISGSSPGMPVPPAAAPLGLYPKVSVVPDPDSDATRAAPPPVPFKPPAPALSPITETVVATPFGPLGVSPAIPYAPSSTTTMGTGSVVQLRPVLLGLFGAVVIVTTALAVRSASSDTPKKNVTPTSFVEPPPSSTTTTDPTQAAQATTPTSTVIIITPPPDDTSTPSAPTTTKALPVPPKKRVTPPHPTHTATEPTATAAPNQR